MVGFMREKSTDCIVSGYFWVELFLKGKHDAFKWVFKSFPPHKKHWLLPAPIQSKPPLGDGAAPWAGLLCPRNPSLSCWKGEIYKQKKQKVTPPGAWGHFGGGTRILIMPWGQQPPVSLLLEPARGVGSCCLRFFQPHSSCLPCLPWVLV